MAVNTVFNFFPRSRKKNLQFKKMDVTRIFIFLSLYRLEGWALSDVFDRLVW